MILAGVILAGLVLCTLLGVWSLVELVTRDTLGLSWDPPPLRTRPPTETAVSTALAVPPRLSPPPTAPQFTPTAAAQLLTATPGGLAALGVAAPTILPDEALPTVTLEPLPTPGEDSPPAADETTAPVVPAASATPPVEEWPVLTPDEAAPGDPPAADAPLLGHRIALDPGHGPRTDLGAVYVNPETNRLVLSEDVVNLDVAQRTRDLLAARGATVLLTREEKDEFTTPWPRDVNGDGINRGQADDLQWRIDQINAFKAEVFLSIHGNSHSNPNKRQGIQALACITDDCDFRTRNLRVGKLALDHLETELAAISYPVTARELRNDMFSDGPGDPLGHLFLTGPAEAPKHPRGITMPGAVVEALYITSPDEVQQLLEPTVRQAIARAYAAALDDFLLTSDP